MKYYVKKVKFIEIVKQTLDKSPNFNNLYFNNTGDEFERIGNYTNGSYNGLDAKELINNYSKKLYTKKVTFHEAANVIHKKGSICFQSEPDENKIMYDTEQSIGLYMLYDENYYFMAGCKYDSHTDKYVIHTFNLAQRAAPAA